VNNDAKLMTRIQHAVYLIICTEYPYRPTPQDQIVLGCSESDFC